MWFFFFYGGWWSWNWKLSECVCVSVWQQLRQAFFYMYFLSPCIVLSLLRSLRRCLPQRVYEGREGGVTTHNSVTWVSQRERERDCEELYHVTAPTNNWTKILPRTFSLFFLILLVEEVCFNKSKNTRRLLGELWKHY